MTHNIRKLVQGVLLVRQENVSLGSEYFTQFQFVKCFKKINSNTSGSNETTKSF